MTSIIVLTHGAGLLESITVSGSQQVKGHALPICKVQCLGQNPPVESKG